MNKTKPPTHVCGVRGFDQMQDGPCPGCEAKKAMKPPDKIWALYGDGYANPPTWGDEDTYGGTPYLLSTPARDHADELRDELSKFAAACANCDKGRVQLVPFSGHPSENLTRQCAWCGPTRDLLAKTKGPDDDE